MPLHLLLCPSCLCSQLNSSITILRLPHNNIPDEGIRSLAECLASNHTITELDLSGNKAGPAGTKALAALLTVRGCGIKTVRLC
jgi:Ran GTPase-activating protein (RanGAP) involved in mRNA processing and transport